MGCEERTIIGELQLNVLFNIDLLRQLSIGRPEQIQASDELHSTFTSSSHCWTPWLILFGIRGKLWQM